jgi:hypothetical protein
VALRHEADVFENAGTLHAVLATPEDLGQSKLTAGNKEALCSARQRTANILGGSSPDRTRTIADSISPRVDRS